MIKGVEAATLATTIEDLRQPTAAWVAAKEAEIRTMRTELAELREFQRQTMEAEERVRKRVWCGSEPEMAADKAWSVAESVVRRRNDSDRGLQT